MTDYKQLCGELLNRLNGLYEEVIDAGVGCVPDEAQDLMNRAWDAMAEPEPEKPTDKELLELMPEAMRDEFSHAATVCSDVTGGQVEPGIFRVCLNTAALEYARAVLAHWSNHLGFSDSSTQPQ